MMLLPNLPPATEGIRLRQENTKAFMNQRPLGDGTLVIAESRVTWVKDGDDTGLSLEYPHIAIHAVSRDPASFSFPCLYLMIDVEMEPREEEDEDRESDDEDEAGMTEIRFVPADHMALEPMYKNLSDCQALHPNPEDVQSEDEIGEENDDEGDYIVSDPGQNGFHMSGTYEDNMEDLENDDGEAMETGQFDDAEDI
ncbi:methylosome subunit pICln-like isoform X2 [Macrobrachium nipponense]|uniref:methylosome subunit pICln-like isoform X2 n=1 Tax=Macrobrachium nipponense TaxID=159736 RepID=UPI0030C7CF74